MEYNGTLTHGDPIKLVCEFKVATPEERAAKKRELEEQLESVNNLETGLEESDSETEEVPSMPDLDALSEELKD
jgi:hypothetical protein